VAVTLWDHIDSLMGGSLKDQLVKWHTEEGLGTPTMAKRLNDMGYEVEQRTVWRWLKQEGISRKGEAS
jgi:transposase